MSSHDNKKSDESNKMHSIQFLAEKKTKFF